MVFLKEFFIKVDFEKDQQTTKKHEKYPGCKVLRTGPEVIGLFSCLSQLSTKFILLINVKMPTIVGILPFISMKNTARNFFICWYSSFYEQLTFHAQLS